MGNIKSVLSGAVRATMLGMLALTVIPAIMSVLIGIPYLARNLLNAPDWVVFVIVFVEVSFLLGGVIMAREGDL